MTTSKLLGVGKTKSKTHIEIRNHLTRSTYLHKTLRSIPPRNSGKTTRIRDRGSPAELDGLITATEFGQVPVRIGGQLTDDGRVHRAAAAASLARDTAGGQNVRQGEKSVYGFSLLCFFELVHRAGQHTAQLLYEASSKMCISPRAQEGARVVVGFENTPC